MMCTTVDDLVLRYIAREYAPRRFASKLLAKDAGTSHRTAERWLAKKAAPSGPHLTNMLVECDGLADELYRMIEQRRAAKGK